MAVQHTMFNFLYRQCFLFNFSLFDTATSLPTEGVLFKNDIKKKRWSSLNQTLACGITAYSCFVQ